MPNKTEYKPSISSFADEDFLRAGNESRLCERVEIKRIPDGFGIGLTSHVFAYIGEDRPFEILSYSASDGGWLRIQALEFNFAVGNPISKISIEDILRAIEKHRGSTDPKVRVTCEVVARAIQYMVQR